MKRSAEEIDTSLQELVQRPIGSFVDRDCFGWLEEKNADLERPGVAIPPSSSLNPGEGTPVADITEAQRSEVAQLESKVPKALPSEKPE